MDASTRRPVPPRLDDPAWVDDIVAQAVRQVASGTTAAEVPSRDGTTAGPSPRRAGRVVRKVARGAPAPVETGLAGESSEPAPDNEVGEPLARTDWLARPLTRRRLAAGLEWVLVVLGALLVAVAIKTFLIQAFYIPSGSMLPTLAPDDRVLVNKVSYDLHDVNRGDLIVFSRPAEVGGDIDDLIKRVIGLPGDTVEVRQSVVYVNGLALDEPYLEAGVSFADTRPVVVPPGMVFVMGDNRPGSRDSRVFGPVPVEDIVGRAFFRIWPPSRAGFL